MKLTFAASNVRFYIILKPANILQAIKCVLLHLAVSGILQIMHNIIKMLRIKYFLSNCHMSKHLLVKLTKKRTSQNFTSSAYLRGFNFISPSETSDN